SARGGGEDPDPPCDRRGGGPRRAGSVLGRGGYCGLRGARGCSRSERAGAGHHPCRKSAALQNAEAIFLLGGAAEIRLWQGAEAAGPRRTGGAGAARRKLQAEKLTMRHIVQPGPPAPERVQWVEARGRAFSFTLE